MIDFYPYEPFFDNNEIQTKYGVQLSLKVKSKLKKPLEKE